MVNGRCGSVFVVPAMLLAFVSLVACRSSDHAQVTAAENPAAVNAPQPNSLLPTGLASAQANAGKPPAFAAVVVNNEDGSAIAIADLGRGEVQPLTGADSPPHFPVWSPDAQRLVFRVDDSLLIWTTGKGPVSLIQAVASDAVTPYAFSPDSASIAVALADAIALLSFNYTPEQQVNRRATLPPGCRPVDFLWSADSQRLYSLCRSDDLKLGPQLIQLDRSGAVTSRSTAMGVTRLLGWRATSILASRSGSSGDEVGTLSATGEFHRLRSGENGESVLKYAVGPDLLILEQPKEDMGDPELLRLTAPDHPGSHSWLEKSPRLTDLALTSDGRWAMFVDHKGYESDMPGGDLCMAPVGSEQVRIVLKGKPGNRSYSLPMPRP
jgi:hypothetical protein